ncbi:MAG: hypothetical protein C5B55_04465 [Blastocatellia bacterium]|nr:MAG: hypothetical protein C5B55_04465 [Blastocatellia bacterium]
MKILAAIFAVLLLSNGVAHAQWKKDDKSVEDTPDRKSVGAFGAQLLVVRDPRGFIEDWQKPQTPEIKPVSEVKRGELLGAFVLFAGCKPDEREMCNSEVDYSFYRPDGSLYAERKQQPLWKEQAPPSANIQLSRAILGIRMEKDDPPGEYKIKAKVSDLNAVVSFELETMIRLK